MSMLKYVVSVASLRVVLAANSTQLRGVSTKAMPNLTSTGISSSMAGESGLSASLTLLKGGVAAMTDNDTSNMADDITATAKVVNVMNNTTSDMADETAAKAEDSEVLNVTVTTVKDGQWSQYFGDSFFGRDGPAKICPGRSYITKWTSHASSGFSSGVHKIGHVECSNGKRLSCCDGGDKPFQTTDVFERRRGFTSVQGAHSFWGFKFCFNGRCAGKVNDKSFNYRCPSGTVLAGYKTKSSLFDLRAIQFFCRRRGYGGGGGDRRCGVLRPLPRWMCPRDPYDLAPCFRADVYSLCRATGKCRRVNALRNCQGRSVYVKVGA